MALPKSPCLISTPQSDLFLALMGLPELDHVGTREEKIPLCVCRFPGLGFRGQTRLAQRSPPSPRSDGNEPLDSHSGPAGKLLRRLFSLRWE